MNKDDKIRKWLDGNLSGSEKKEFESTKEFEKISRLLKAVDNFKAPEYDTDKEFRKLSNNIIKRTTTNSLYRKISPVLRIAAVFVFALLFAYTVYDQLIATKNTGEWIAEQKELYLPDSSFVSLNADSRIRIANSNWEEERNVELQGEAFFNVKDGSQFKVKTRQGTVTVLGTEFGIKDRSTYYEVTCYSGRIQVVAAQNNITLKPGSVFRIINSNAENYSISNKSKPDWLNGESSFKSVPLKLVVNELERQYKVDVKGENVDLNQLFTGSFTNRNLEVALESITFPVNLGYRINGKKIVLSVEDN